MFCWLAFGEYEALKRDMKRGRSLIPAEGKHTIPPRIHPADRRGATLRRAPWEAQMFCWPAFGEYEASEKEA